MSADGEQIKHVGPTPGPWIVDEVNTPNGVGYFINHLWQESVHSEAADEAGGEEESITHTDEIAEVVMDYRDDRALCNARLIAAAPYLLEACRSAVETLEQLVKINRIPASSKGLRDARAAIAKAEGIAAK